MSALARLITDLDGSLGRGSGEDRARTLARLTDLFVLGAEGFGPAEVELFDAVLARVVAATETPSRVRLADRLAPLANGPPGVILTLANDEIVVARPVLARSPRLADQDLMAIALRHGRDHMLAICDRAALSEIVTDVLVREGDGVVRHAVAGNLGARLSALGASSLLGQSRRDGALGELLRDRPDLRAGPPRALAAAVAAQALGHLGAPTESTEPEVTEADLARYAAERQGERAMAALAALTGLPAASVGRIFDERDNDLLLVIGKARGWSWRTVRLLLQLRDPRLSERHQFRRAEETFDGLATATAQRVVHFLKLRELAGPTAPAGGRSEARRLSGA